MLKFINYYSALHVKHFAGLIILKETQNRHEKHCRNKIDKMINNFINWSPLSIHPSINL